MSIIYKARISETKDLLDVPLCTVGSVKNEVGSDDCDIIQLIIVTRYSRWEREGGRRMNGKIEMKEEEAVASS